jgi:3',5'-cyclic AMP phosphodiesterase CpdA
MTLRIVHLSDIHFGGEDASAVRTAPDAVRALAPDLTVVTGDLTANGAEAEFRAAADWLARLPSPVLVTPGNHDTPYWNLVLRLFEPFARYRRHIGGAVASAFDGPGLSARSLNSARGVQPRLNWSKGALSLVAVKALEWPEDPATLRLFACHHPLVDPEGAPVTGGVPQGPAAIAELARRGVELVLSGHLHNPFAARPVGHGDCYAVGAGTLSLRTRGTPASFSTISADAEAFEITVQVWKGDRFDAGPMRRLPRQTQSSAS